MKCTKCMKNEATVFYREVINGKETKYALCSECAADKEKEMNESIFKNFYEPFDMGLLGNFFGSAPAVSKKEEKKCTLCGATFNELCNLGKAGCPMCYSVFREEFESTVSRLHGNALHRGRVPKKFRAEKEEKEKRHNYEKELKKAIAEERYEDAAKIRDTLRGMEA